MATLRNRRNRTDDDVNAIRFDPSTDQNLSPILRNTVAGVAAGQGTRTGAASRSEAPSYDSILRGAVDEGQLVLARQEGTAPTVSPFAYRDNTPSFVSAGLAPSADGGLSQGAVGTGIPEMSVDGVPSVSNIPNSAILDMQDDAVTVPEVGTFDVVPRVEQGYRRLVEVPPSPIADEAIVAPEAPEAIVERMTTPITTPVSRSDERLPAGITRGPNGEGGEFHWRGIPLSQIRAEEQARNLPPEINARGDIAMQPAAGASRPDVQLSAADARAIARARGATGSQVNAEARRILAEDQDRRALNAARVVSTLASAEAVPERLRQRDEQLGISRSRLESSEAEAERRQGRAERSAAQRDRSLDQRDRQLSTSERLAEQRIESAKAAIDRDLARLGFEERRTAAQEASTGERIAASQDSRQLARDRFTWMMENPNAMQSTVNSIQRMVSAGELSNDEGREAMMRAIMGGRPPEGYMTWDELQMGQEQATSDAFDADTERRLSQFMSDNNVDRQTAISAARQAGLIN